MPLSELKMVTAITSLLVLLALTVLVTGSVPIGLRSSFSRVFRLLLLVFSAFLVPTAAWRSPASYSSTVRIEVGSGVGRSDENSLCQREAERITSPAVLRLVAADLRVQDLLGPPFDSVPLNENDAGELLARAIKVNPVANRSAIDIRVFGESRRAAATFANQIADEYARQAQLLIPPLNIKVAARARPARFPTFSNMTRNTSIGLGFSALIAVIVTGLWTGLNASKIRLFALCSRTSDNA